jgi:hypothetical protein
MSGAKVSAAALMVTGDEQGKAAGMAWLARLL